MKTEEDEGYVPDLSINNKDWTTLYPQAATVEVDFSKAQAIYQHASGVLRDRDYIGDQRPRTAEGKLLTPKQIRARARRRLARGSSSKRPGVTKEEFEALYKPIEEWDLDELARGRPRDSKGGFSGRAPGWVTREVYEQAMQQFQEAIKSRMGEHGISALDTVSYLLSNEEVDHRGKPIVPPSVKLEASKFLLEHIVGKPKQHVQQDISVKLQGILGAVMANPNDAFAPPSQGGRLGDTGSDLPGYSFAHTPGITLPMGRSEVVEGEVVEDDDSDLDEED